MYCRRKRMLFHLVQKTIIDILWSVGLWPLCLTFCKHNKHANKTSLDKSKWMASLLILLLLEFQRKQWSLPAWSAILCICNKEMWLICKTIFIRWSVGRGWQTSSLVKCCNCHVFPYIQMILSYCICIYD